jgi:hypothetical protein
MKVLCIIVWFGHYTCLMSDDKIRYPLARHVEYN